MFSTTRHTAPTLLTLMCLTLFMGGCKDKEPEDDVTLPTNLTLSVEIDQNDPATVLVSASAEKANFFTFVFSETGEESEIESSDGLATYQYAASGTYSIIARAHSTYEKYIEVSENVVIELDPPGNNGNPPTTGYASPESYPGYTLVWQDEFNGSALSADWNQEIGNGNSGWGNNELQYYRAENTTVSDGFLQIQARSEFFDGYNYTSSRITTQAKQSFKYGRIDIRAALPYGQGLWPALWMLGDNIGTEGWPACGEIDIVELVGGNIPGGGDNVVHGTAHWDDNGHADFGNSNALSSGTYADEFHVFSIIWDAQSIRWYRDDIKYHELDISSASLSEFHANFFLIFNVAVGGNWPGNPNASTSFPQSMYVDYVRVFQQ